MQRFSKPTHTIGVNIAVPHKPTNVPVGSTMTPLETAFQQGKEAKRRGLAAEHPFNDLLTPNDGHLVSEWMRGYNS